MARLHPFAVVSLVRELRAAAGTKGPLCVAGAPALVEALRKELVRGGDASSVRVGLTDGAEALVYVLAEAPKASDRETLAAARRAKVPIVALLAGPDLERAVPFVLATDVVTVPVGSGFPLDEIADALAHRLGERGTSLASRLPVLRESVCKHLVESFARKTALVGVAVWIPGADLPVITLAQLRLVLRIAAAHGLEIDQQRVPEAVAVISSGFAFRGAARQLLGVVPIAGWAVKGAVAYAGTRAVGEAAMRFYAARQPAPTSETTS